MRMGTAISGGNLARFISACFAERRSTATVDTIGPVAGRRQSHRAVTRIRRGLNGITLQIPMKKCRGLSVNERKQWVDELDNSLPYFCDNRCPGCRGEEK